MKKQKHRNARLSKAERRRKFTNNKNKARRTYIVGNDALIAPPVKYDWKFTTKPAPMRTLQSIADAAAETLDWKFPQENKVEVPEPITAITTDSKGMNVFTKDAVYRSQPCPDEGKLVAAALPELAAANERIAVLEKLVVLFASELADRLTGKQ